VVGSVVDTGVEAGEIGMGAAMAEGLAEFRAFNYEQIYMRPASVAQGQAVVRVLQALVEHYADRPNALPRPAERLHGVEPGSAQAFREAVTYVGGMTDRFAFNEARVRLGWRTEDLPAGIA
jgi:dGTPase